MTTLSGTPVFEAINQTICRTIVAFHVFAASKFRQNAVGELFTQLNAPLVKGEDIEDDALREDFVLVHGDQRTQAVRSDFAQQDGVGWSVTFKHFEWRNVFNVFWFFALEIGRASCR